MRVVHIIKVVRIAGAEQHLLTLLEGLRANHIDARIVLLVEPSNPMENYVQAAGARGIPLERVVIRSHVDMSLHYRLWKLLKDLQPDIVHTHLLHADLFGIPAARAAGVPIVVTSRHNDNTFRRRSPIKQMNRSLWEMADAGIAISHALARFCIEIEGAPPEKIHTIYYGLDANRWSVDAGSARAVLRGELNMGKQDMLVGLACRLIEQKGVNYGLRAFERVAQHFPTAHLVIAGEGPMRDALENQARWMVASERVHFLGWRADVPFLLAGLDILLAPSLWEGFGLVLLEAMAQAVPIIASDVSALPEIVVHGETGLLVPPRDADALAEALALLLGDKALRRHLGLMGQERLEDHFDTARMIGETIALYERLLRDYRRRNPAGAARRYKDR
jgi:glycosyltransferase involved in cell wall biosynthesis